MENYLEYKIEILEFFPNLLVFVLLSISGYFVIVFLVDKKTKELFKNIINELKK